tara:strand:- start:17615 stop:18493 length:879 start_codon:yes stop_codon:yes gene_type:complete
MNEINKIIENKRKVKRVRDNKLDIFKNEKVFFKNWLANIFLKSVALNIISFCVLTFLLGLSFENLIFIFLNPEKMVEVISFSDNFDIFAFFMGSIFSFCHFLLLSKMTKLEDKYRENEIPLPLAKNGFFIDLITMIAPAFVMAFSYGVFIFKGLGVGWFFWVFIVVNSIFLVYCLYIKTMNPKASKNIKSGLTKIKEINKEIENLNKKELSLKKKMIKKQDLMEVLINKYDQEEYKNTEEKAIIKNVLNYFKEETKKEIKKKKELSELKELYERKYNEKIDLKEESVQISNI